MSLEEIVVQFFIVACQATEREHFVHRCSTWIAACLCIKQYSEPNKSAVVVLHRDDSPHSWN